MKYFNLLWLCALLVFSSCSKKEPMVDLPYNLQSEYLNDPVGIDVLNPRLSWKIE